MPLKEREYKDPAKNGGIAKEIEFHNRMVKVDANGNVVTEPKR